MERIVSKKFVLKIYKEISFECMSIGTPQKNSWVERGFPKIYSRMCTMMAHTVIYENLKTGIWYI